MKASKYYLVSTLILFFISINALANNIQWHSMEELLNGKNIKNKPIYIYFYTNWDGFSKKFDKETLADKRVSNTLNETFFCVKFNIENTTVYTYKNKDFGVTKIGNRKIHSLYLNWFDKPISVPAHQFLDKKLLPIGNRKGFVKPAIFSLFIESLNIPKGNPNDFLKPNMDDLNESIHKIITNYKTDFKNIRGDKINDSAGEEWKSTIKIPKEVKSKIYSSPHSDGSINHTFYSTLLQKVNRKDAIQFIKDFTQVLLKSNLKSELKAYYISYKFFENKLYTKIEIIPHKEAIDFKNISISLVINRNSFFYKDIVDVDFIINKKND